MPQVDPTIAIYAYISGSWTLLDDTGGNDLVRASWGMADNSPSSRLADTGDFTFALNNATGQYTPDGPSALAGWKKGVPVKIVFTYDSEEYVRFYGVVSDIKARPSNREQKCYVTVLDWMDYAARHPIVNPGIQTSKRGDEVMTTVMNEIEIPPQAYDFDTGTETFPTVFDTVTSRTKGYNEFGKVAFSELGYVYLKKDKTYGETLRFEAADARHGWREPDDIPLASSASGYLLKEDGGYLLKEDGGKIILNEIGAPLTMDDTVITDYDAPYGEHVINRMTVYAYPRRVGASPEILFQLDQEITIGSGQTYTLKGYWADPNGGLPINAQNVIEPDPSTSTDCSAFTATGGGGSDITTSLVLNNWNPGTEGFTVDLYNGNAATMYVYTFKPRGTAIRQFNPIEHSKTNSESIAEFEYSSETIHQKYKDTTYSGRVFVDSQVDEHKQPRTVLNSISFIANKSADCMMTFLNTDVGDLRYIEISELGIAGNYYVQGVEFEVKGNIVFVKWIVLLALSLQTGCGLSPLAVEFGGETTTDGINFGYLSQIANHDERSLSVWIYHTADSPDDEPDFIMGFFGDGSAFGLYAGSTSVAFVTKYTPNGQAFWNTGAASVSQNAWHHIVVTKSRILTTGDAPIIYVDNTTPSLTVGDAPENLAAYPEDGVNFSIGNVKTATLDYTWGFKGKIFDARVYNRILTAAEVTEIYNSGTPDEAVGTKDGLVFQAFAVRTEDTADYIDETLTAALTLRDNIGGYVGVPHGAPIGRAAP